jgi:O-acetyl-ADP-ribose deacetylase (regulator of RNase III)
MGKETREDQQAASVSGEEQVKIVNIPLRNFQASSIQWTLKEGNIIDEPVDVLICSANVSLNLSGGVGADLLGRYGTKMQKDLHQIIASRTPHAARQGEVFAYSGEELPYKAILHAVGVDGWYHSSPDIIRETLEKSLQMAAGFGAQKIAMTALATGYGDLTLNDFADAIRPLINRDFIPIREVCICLMEDYRLAELASRLFV